jgi:hypothetical protein
MFDDTIIVSELEWVSAPFKIEINLDFLGMGHNIRCKEGRKKED